MGEVSVRDQVPGLNHLNTNQAILKIPILQSTIYGALLFKDIQEGEVDVHPVRCHREL